MSAWAALLFAACGASTGLDLGAHDIPEADGDADADGDGDGDGDVLPDPCDVGWAVADLEEWGEGAPSLAVDPDGRLHVAYVGVHDRAFTLGARRDSGAWEIERPGVVGLAPSIAFDDAGVEHVAATGEDEVRHLAAPDLDVEVVASATGGAGSPLAFGGDGALRIAFHDDETEDVALAVLRDGAWGVEMVESAADPLGNLSDDLELAMQGDLALLAYVATSCDRGCAPEVRFATNEGGAWAVDKVADARERPSLAVAPDGTIHLVSFVADGAELVHATRSADGWISETVDVDGAATSCMAIGSDGTVLVAYWRRGELRSATRVPEGWAIRTVARSGVVPYCAAAFDGRGSQHIVFVDDHHGDGVEGTLRHATRECE